MLAAFGFHINVMPFVMTSVNLIAARIYASRLAKSERMQLYILSGIFFVLLYTAPVALVFYWTINNALSILKTGIYARLGILHDELGANQTVGG
jgi:membrane protein insertase Oxa1/YidC/SpoIIIJ